MFLTYSHFQRKFFGLLCFFHFVVFPHPHLLLLPSGLGCLLDLYDSTCVPQMIHLLLAPTHVFFLLIVKLIFILSVFWSNTVSMFTKVKKIIINLIKSSRKLKRESKETFFRNPMRDGYWWRSLWAAMPCEIWCKLYTKVFFVAYFFFS